MKMRFVFAAGLALIATACEQSAITTAPQFAVVASAPQEAQLPAELAAARRATARYQNVEAALADGYEDIDVVVPGMGRHFLKASLVDDIFDPAEPELLVYAPDPSGRLRLVAVEYAEPLTDTPPEGFAGDSDEWFADHKFDLWTLHAWIWLDNPDGLFSRFNARVP